MSIMAFEFPILEMDFVLGEFEFKVCTLEIDFKCRIVTVENRFSNLNFLLLMATLGHRSYYVIMSVITDRIGRQEVLLPINH